MAPKIIEVKLPEYQINIKPDYLKLGKKVDKFIEKNIPNGKYIVRAISLDEHPNLNLQKLTDIVKVTGTDKYNKKRKGIGHNEFRDYDYDIQAGVITIKHNKVVIPKDYKYPTEFGDIIYHFYQHDPLDRGYPVRIDLLLFYDFYQLEKAKRIRFQAKEIRKELENYLYKFKYPQRKRDSLLFIFKILR